MISCGIIFLGKIIINSVIELVEKGASIEFQKLMLTKWEI